MQPIKALVCDDNQATLTLIENLLKRSHYHVVTAENGKNALKLYQKDDVDVIITDIFMPEMDGLELIMDIRRRNPEAKIVAFSSGGGMYSPERCLEIARQMGANSVISKSRIRHDLLPFLQTMFPNRGTKTPTEKPEGH